MNEVPVTLEEEEAWSTMQSYDKSVQDTALQFLLEYKIKRLMDGPSFMAKNDKEKLEAIKSVIKNVQVLV